MSPSTVEPQRNILSLPGLIMDPCSSKGHRVKITSLHQRIWPEKVKVIPTSPQRFERGRKKTLSGYFKSLGKHPHPSLMAKNTSPHPAAANIWTWSLRRWLMRAAPNGTCECVARSSFNSCHLPNFHLGLGRSSARTLHAFFFNCVKGYLRVCHVRSQSNVAVWKQVVTNAFRRGFRWKEAQRNAKNENKAWGMTV